MHLDFLRLLPGLGVLDLGAAGRSRPRRSKIWALSVERDDAEPVKQGRGTSPDGRGRRASDASSCGILLLL